MCSAGLPNLFYEKPALIRDGGVEEKDDPVRAVDVFDPFHLVTDLVNLLHDLTVAVVCQ